ncbi:LCP family protein [Arthrobacter monumenti]
MKSNPMQSMLTDPVRYPQTAPAELRTKRAFTLLLMTLVLPGSAQIVAGNRRLGRRALRVTFAAWAAVITAVVLYFVNRALLFGLFTHQVWSLVIIAVLVLLAIGWALMFLNTLRIIRPGLLTSGMRPVVAVSLAALMLLTSGALGYSAYMLNIGRNAISDVFVAGPDMEPVDGRYNFLLMGGDAGESREGRRPDSISVISVDAETGQPIVFGIPRNLQNAPFPADSPMNQVYPDGYNCGDACIINSLYTEVTLNYADLYPEAEDPGAAAMMDAASGILGLEVQGYVLVDMAGFEKLIDAMGGITIDVGGRVPIGGGTNLETGMPNEIKGYIEPGVQNMDGYTALWYARSREGATDYDRMARQRCVQQAMISQLNPATLLTKFQGIAAAGTQIIESNISSSQLNSFLDLALKAKGKKLLSLTAGPPDYGINFPTYPDFAVLQQDVQALIEKSGKESEEPKPDGGSQAQAPSGSSGEGQSAPSEQAPAESAPSPAPSGGGGGGGLSPNGTCSVP